MDIVNNLLFWLHLVSLALGGVGAFGIPVVGSMMPMASAETRPTLFKAAHGLSRVSRIGLAGLIITGPLLVWLKFGGMAGFNWWFSLKMVLVLVMLAGVISSGILLKRAEGGDSGAGRAMPAVGAGLLATFLAIVLCAVFAFN